MISERELEQLIHNPLIRKAAAHARPIGVWRSTADDRAANALAAWIAVLTRQYLRDIGAASAPLVEKIWKFSGGAVDIDMRVGVNGAYRKLKIETGMVGPYTIKLQIRDWHKALVGFAVQDREDRWERFGAYRGNDDRQGIETLPVR